MISGSSISCPEDTDRGVRDFDERPVFPREPMVRGLRELPDERREPLSLPPDLTVRPDITRSFPDGPQVR